MITSTYQNKSLSEFLQFLGTPVPWQHLYRQTFGKKHLTSPPSYRSILTSIIEDFDPLTFSPSEMTMVSAPDESTWADPFLWSSGGKTYLFEEELPVGKGQAHISVVELDSRGLPIGLPAPVIKDKFHYSYPFVFEYDGDLWMLPENSTSKRLQLHRCVEFPHKWVPDKILMEGVCYADPTLFEHEGRWWLFMTFGSGFYGVNTNLFLFSAESPLSNNWTPHPLNPIVSGFQHSRPAGRLFNSNGRLFRPSQDCFIRYGNGLRINEIVRLDPEHYEEKCVREIKPWSDEILGVHHLEISGDLILMDIHTLSKNRRV